MYLPRFINAMHKHDYKTLVIHKKYARKELKRTIELLHP